MNIACPHCGHLNAEDARFCADCQDRLWTEAAPPHEPVHPERRPEPEQVRMPGQRGGLHVTIETGSLAVEPGTSTSTTILVHNSGTQNDTVTVTVDGSAREWASVEPESFTVLPDTQVEATVRFAPPHAPGSAAGPRWYTVRVTSGSHPGVADTAEGTLAVGAFRDLDAELVPRETRGRRRRTVHAVRLTNSGNVLEQVALEAVDDDESLLFTLPAEETSVAPGAVTMVDLQVCAPRRWIGRPRSHPFHVTASSGGDEPERLDGTRVAVPLLSRWMGIAAVAAVLAAVAAVVLPPILFPPPAAQAGPSDASVSAPQVPGPAAGGGAPEVKPPEVKPPEAPPAEADPPKQPSVTAPVPKPADVPAVPVASTSVAPPAPTTAPPTTTTPPTPAPEPPVVVTTPPTTTTPPPVLVSTGLVEMANPSSIDLDRGVVPERPEDADLDLKPATVPDAGPVLAPSDDTRLALGGVVVGVPAPDQCKDRTPSSDPVRVADLKMGSVLCVITDQGHLAVLRVDRIPVTADEKFAVTYATYEKP